MNIKYNRLNAISEICSRWQSDEPIQEEPIQEGVIPSQFFSDLNEEEEELELADSGQRYFTEEVNRIVTW